MPTDRAAAINLLESHVKTKNLVKPCLACEAVLGALAARLGEEEEAWRRGAAVYAFTAEVFGEQD